MLTLKLHNFVGILFATKYYTCEIHKPHFWREHIHTSMKGLMCGKQNCVIVHIPCENELQFIDAKRSYVTLCILNQSQMCTYLKKGCPLGWWVDFKHNEKWLWKTDVWTFT